jgi:hypothetical protein
MQKLLLALFLSVAATTIYAQDLDEINEMISKNQWDKAKAGIDKYLSNPKKANDANGWYFKGLIYNEIAKSDQFKTLDPNARMIAFEAFKKTLELEPKNVRMTLEQNVRLFDIYNGYFDLGAEQFNQKKFDDAYTNFKNALMVEEYISKNGFSYNNFSFPQFDTSLIQNIALSAYSAKKEDEAAVWYQKMAEQKIAGKDYLDIYQFLVEYYNRKKDMANREKYLNLGRELFPENDYWCLVPLNDVDDKDKPKLFAKYEEVMATDCGKRYSLAFNYAVEVFNYTYTGDTKPANYSEMQAKLESILNKTIAINNTPEANMLMSRHYYNAIYDLQDAQKAIKGTKPEDAKKRADLRAQMISKVDLMLPYALKAHEIYAGKSTLKPSEKGNFKVVTDILVSAYELKGQKDKAEEYKKKLDAIN